jgi:hypothetical protein
VAVDLSVEAVDLSVVVDDGDSHLSTRLDCRYADHLIESVEAGKKTGGGRNEVQI